MHRRVGWLLVPFGWALACGGRMVETTPEGDGDTGGISTGQGGSTQVGKAGSARGGATGAGATSRGGSTHTGKAGAAATAGVSSVGGSVGVGGTFSVGGMVGMAGSFAAGGGCACDPIGCGPGYRPVPNANGCCYHCELDLKTCQVQRESYLNFRAQLLDKYRSVGCKLSSECSIYYEKTACGSWCGVPVPSVVLKDLDANLNSFAQMACGPACPTSVEGPCEPDQIPECWKGYCE